MITQSVISHTSRGPGNDFEVNLQLFGILMAAAQTVEDFGQAPVLKAEFGTF